MDAAVAFAVSKLRWREIQELSDVFIDCVEGGASVSFMWRMTGEAGFSHSGARSPRRSALIGA